MNKKDFYIRLRLRLKLSIINAVLRYNCPKR